MPVTSRVLLAALLCAAGVLHFVRPAAFAAIVPPPVPPGPAVALSGAAEILLGLGLLPRRTRRVASWGVVALLLAVWPANIHMAVHAGRFPDLPAWALWLRVPLQVPLMLWALSVGRSPVGSGRGPSAAPPERPRSGRPPRAP